MKNFSWENLFHYEIIKSIIGDDEICLSKNRDIRGYSLLFNNDLVKNFENVNGRIDSELDGLKSYAEENFTKIKNEHYEKINRINSIDVFEFSKNYELIKQKVEMISRLPNDFGQKNHYFSGIEISDGKLYYKTFDEDESGIFSIKLEFLSKPFEEIRDHLIGEKRKKDEAFKRDKEKRDSQILEKRAKEEYQMWVELNKKYGDKL